MRLGILFYTAKLDVKMKDLHEAVVRNPNICVSSIWITYFYMFYNHNIDILLLVKRICVSYDV